MKKLIYGMFILVVVLGIALFVMLPKDSGSSSGSSSSGGSGSQGHTCYVCGESGNMKYGSHYYCKTHWAMVKTVDEAG